MWPFNRNEPNTSYTYEELAYPDMVLMEQPLPMINPSTQFISAIAEELGIDSRRDESELYPFTSLDSNNTARLYVTNSLTRRVLTHPLTDKLMIRGSSYESIFEGPEAEIFFRDQGFPGVPVFWGSSLLLLDPSEQMVLTGVKKAAGPEVQTIYDARLISLPGGKTDIKDFQVAVAGTHPRTASLKDTLRHTALREAIEETGVDLSRDGVLTDTLVMMFLDGTRNKGQAFVYATINSTLPFSNETDELVDVRFRPVTELEKINTSPELQFAISLIKKPVVG
jgi:8-oxo-dGTP pyrophosphatase MutT (NUDIX family)